MLSQRGCIHHLLIGNPQITPVLAAHGTGFHLIKIHALRGRLFFFLRLCRAYPDIPSGLVVIGAVGLVDLCRAPICRGQLTAVLLFSDHIISLLPEPVNQLLVEILFSGLTDLTELLRKFLIGKISVKLFRVKIHILIFPIKQFLLRFAGMRFRILDQLL